MGSCAVSSWVGIVILFSIFLLSFSFVPIFNRMSPTKVVKRKHQMLKSLVTFLITRDLFQMLENLCTKLQFSQIRRRSAARNFFFLLGLKSKAIALNCFDAAAFRYKFPFSVLHTKYRAGNVLALLVLPCSMSPPHRYMKFET
jgi:hypothetical protein